MSFEDLDLNAFWAPLGEGCKRSQPKPASEIEIRELQEELQFRLPASYIELMRSQNGGVPLNTCFPSNESTSWAHDHVAISGVFAIGRDGRLSLGGLHGALFWREQWGYPDFGICICDCPSGHDMIMLDYRSNGPDGEPEVVHVDQKAEFETTWLAKDFENFIRGLVHPEAFEDSESDLALDLERVAQGAFSPMLKQLLNDFGGMDLSPVLRKLCAEITTHKGYFALHGDAASHLVYGLQFLLLSEHQKVDKASFLALYPKLIALGACAFSTGGYAPDFVEDWLSAQLVAQQILPDRSGILCCSPTYRDSLFAQSKRCL